MTEEEAKKEIIDMANALQLIPNTPKGKAVSMALKALEQTRWIPVSERLPEEFESVLVCYKSQGGMAQAVSERFVNMDGSNRWSALAGIEPIAWMPLPESYKPQESEEV